jgi:hypothetical protein
LNTFYYSVRDENLIQSFSTTSREEPFGKSMRREKHNKMDIQVIKKSWIHLTEDGISVFTFEHDYVICLL